MVIIKNENKTLCLDSKNIVGSRRRYYYIIIYHTIYGNCKEVARD